MADNNTIIPSPNSPLVDKLGNIDPAWYQFLTQIFKRTGSDTGAVIDITAIYPLISTGGITPELSIRAATSATAGAMTAGDKAKLDALSYSTGTWTPTLSFDTPGNLAVTYTTRTGNYTQIGNQVSADFVIITSAFTWSTASGSLRIAGIPFPINPTFPEFTGTLSWSGLTIAGSTMIVPQILLANTSIMRLTASGSGAGRTQIGTANTTSGAQLTISGHIDYFV